MQQDGEAASGMRTPKLPFFSYEQNCLKSFYTQGGIFFHCIHRVSRHSFNLGVIAKHLLILSHFL